jgi:hypothetical protein
MRLTPDELAMFLHREHNSLHYRPANDGNEFHNGYSTAIDGIAARLARELRGQHGFDESRFLAIIAGTIDPTKN